MGISSKPPKRLKKKFLAKKEQNRASYGKNIILAYYKGIFPYKMLKKWVISIWGGSVGSRRLKSMGNRSELQKRLKKKFWAKKEQNWASYGKNIILVMYMGIFPYKMFKKWVVSIWGGSGVYRILKPMENGSGPQKMLKNKFWAKKEQNRALYGKNIIFIIYKAIFKVWHIFSLFLYQKQKNR